MEKQFWDKVLQSGWQKRYPAFIKTKIFLRYQITISFQEAEDIFQNTLARVLIKETIKACLEKDSEEVRKIIYGYLNFLIKEWWRDEIIRKHQLKHDNIEDHEHSFNVSPDNAKRLFRETLNELTVIEKTVFELYYLNSNTQTDIKNQLDKSLGTINNILKSIQNKFYDIFERNQGGLK